MILIIADDLSGAAELAGIAATRGYTAEVHTELDTSSKAEVIAVDSQTRSLSTAEAGARIRSIVEAAKEFSIEWIYKKTDSVLRGNIRAELESLMEATAKQRTLLIPANPGKTPLYSQWRVFCRRPTTTQIGVRKGSGSSTAHFQCRKGVRLVRTTSSLNSRTRPCARARHGCPRRGQQERSDFSCARCQ